MATSHHCSQTNLLNFCASFVCFWFITNCSRHICLDGEVLLLPSKDMCRWKHLKLRADGLALAIQKVSCARRSLARQLCQMSYDVASGLFGRQNVLGKNIRRISCAGFSSFGHVVKLCQEKAVSLHLRSQKNKTVTHVSFGCSVLFSMERTIQRYT